MIARKKVVKHNVPDNYFIRDAFHKHFCHIFKELNLLVSVHNGKEI
jgi:hypothetical protein